MKNGTTEQSAPSAAHNHILKLFSRECASGSAMTLGLLKAAVGTFSTNRAVAISAFQRLQAKDPSAFTLAAVRLLASAEGEPSGGLQYISDLMSNGDLLIDLLLDERTLRLEAALPLTRSLATEEPLVDVHLVRRLIANAGGDLEAISEKPVLRALELVDAVSDCSRLSSHLVQLMRHPSAHVRSKATLLLGRANVNLARVKAFLASDDARVVANAVESLWGRHESGVREMLWQATKSPHGRAVVNALLELYRWGETEAHTQLVQLAGGDNPALRSGAAWAMGESGDPKFKELLEKLEQDEDDKVRAMAERSRKKLRAPDPEVSAELVEVPAEVVAEPPKVD